jgi:Putative adhesin
MDSRVLRSLAAVPLALAVTACDLHLGNLAGRATDEWTHTYPLTAGGQVRIGNTNGKIEIEGVDGSTVEIRAERIAKGVTDTAARELLPRIEIKEDVRPDQVSVETARISGIMFGAGFEVRYHVRAPKNTVIDVFNTNGLVTVSGISGKVVAHTTNGGVTGKGLSGGVDARATNGGVNIELASVGSDRIALRTTNGGVTLTVPESAKADVSATCTNGGISVSGVKLEVSEQSRRRLEGKLNGGGTPIELHTTNGGVRLRSKASEDEPRTESGQPDTLPKTLKSRR